MEKKRLDKKKIKNANQKLKKNFFETDDDNHLSGYEVFYIFMICNVIGYCVEMVFCYLKHGYWESRQSLIYGTSDIVYIIPHKTYVTDAYIIFAVIEILGA